MRTPDLPWRYVLSHGPADSVLTRLVLVFLRLRFRWKVAGSLPDTGAVLVSAHTSYWDGLLASALDARVRPVTGKDWRSPRAVGWFLTRYGVIWTDEEPLTAAHLALSNDQLVWIAPAGWERTGPRTLRRGAAEMALAAKAPIYVLRLSRSRFRLQIAVEELLAYDPALTVRSINTVIDRSLYP